MGMRSSWKTGDSRGAQLSRGFQPAFGTPGNQLLCKVEKQLVGLLTDQFLAAGSGRVTPVAVKS